MKKVLIILLIIFLFALGPWAFLNVLDTSVSLKYEVDHAKAMFPGEDFSAIENHYLRNYYFFWIVTVLGPLLGIGVIIFRAKKRKMTGNILLLLSVLFLISCSQEKQAEPDKNDEVIMVNKKEYRFFIKEYKDKFKHKNLVSFDRCKITDLNGDSFIVLRHVPIIKDLAYKIFQDNKYISDTLNEDAKVLYSIQTEQGHQGILIAGMGDDWVDRIEYLSYDLNGKLLARLFLYECGGDGGYSSESFGAFINDSTYIRTSVYCDPMDEETGIYTCDSLTHKFIIHYNGQIEELSK